MLYGTPASEGIGIGRVIFLEEHSLEYENKTVSDTEGEIKRFRNAVKIFRDNTQAQADALKESAGENEARILEGHIQMMLDPYLCSEIEKLISSGQCAQAALDHMCETFITMFSQADDELTRQRAADVRDIRRAMLSILLGVKDVKLSAIPKNTVLVAREFAPSITAGINKENIVGIITEAGSKESHSAILARALGIPTVLNVKNALSKLSAGETVIVDGNKGEIILSPDEETSDKYEQKRIEFIKACKELEKFRGQATASKSGETFDLFCNIGTAEEALDVTKADGEGVGVFRTEFLFMSRQSLPDEEDQFEAYKKAALILKNRPLVIRTLDIGGDKDIPYLGIDKEANPFMGLRAIRFCLENKEIFKTQLRAILRASAFGDVRIMFPMITTVDEYRQGCAIVEECKQELRESKTDFDENIKIGIMAETASVTLIADILAKEVDFFSIGTNDLTGYTVACDRGNEQISYLYSAFQPSVLRSISYIVKCAKENNIPVGMCGEAAADPKMIPLLISFGIDEFSVSSPSVLKVRRSISQWSKSEADEVTKKVMSMATEKEILDFLRISAK